jgi:hypothetical protein
LFFEEVFEFGFGVFDAHFVHGAAAGMNAGLHQNLLILYQSSHILGQDLAPDGAEAEGV